MNAAVAKPDNWAVRPMPIAHAMNSKVTRSRSSWGCAYHTLMVSAANSIAHAIRTINLEIHFVRLATGSMETSMLPRRCASPKVSATAIQAGMTIAIKKRVGKSTASRFWSSGVSSFTSTTPSNGSTVTITAMAATMMSATSISWDASRMSFCNSAANGLCIRVCD